MTKTDRLLSLISACYSNRIILGIKKDLPHEILCKNTYPGREPSLITEIDQTVSPDQKGGITDKKSSIALHRVVTKLPKSPAEPTHAWKVYWSTALAKNNRHSDARRAATGDTEKRKTLVLSRVSQQLGFANPKLGLPN